MSNFLSKKWSPKQKSLHYLKNSIKQIYEDKLRIYNKKSILI
jgi:hypothetical protein